MTYDPLRDLILILVAVILGNLAVLALLASIRWLHQRVRVYRVGRELQAIEKDAYRHRPGGCAHVSRGMSRSEWECGEGDDAA